MYKRFNSNGTLDTAFNVATTTGSTYGEVIVPDYYGKILIGGLEHSINGKSPSGNFAKLNQDGTTSLCGETITYTFYLGTVYNDNPCIPGVLTYDIYQGSDGKYYADQGGTYVLASSISGGWFYFETTYVDVSGNETYGYIAYEATDGSFYDIGMITSPCSPYNIT